MVLSFTPVGGKDKDSQEIQQDFRTLSENSETVMVFNGYLTSPKFPSAQRTDLRRGMAGLDLAI
eukprot:3814058-Rhodomonas_salina.1